MLSKFKQGLDKPSPRHGGADTSLIPQEAVDYYKAVSRKMGGDAKAQAFFCLSMIPGMDHGGLLSGPGIDRDGV
ncbi:MAG: tannase/feruloyl esterase family alpha/beta hydrolase [Desulfobacterales bacterium]|nr:MAG: tannase/feruloyl esterase family alpha/beta hydrolase [Desulfobacterales bacterium]